MSTLQEETREIAGLRTRLLRGGSTGAPMVFVHGGVPGQTPYCSSADIWGESLALFARERRVIAVDLPGAGGTAIPSGRFPTIEGYGEHLRAVLADLQLGPCHLVGHDEGALVALWLAMESPAAVRSVCVVASATAAPSGDGVPNLTLAFPPRPLWARESQAWAIDRLSYAHQHIDATLLDRCAASASGELHRQAVARLGDEANRQAWLASIGKAKGRFFEICRGEGFPVPTQVVWGTHDPLTRPAQGFALYRVVAAHQTATHFHLINRAGSFPFREEPDAFHQIVAGFCDGMTT